VEAASRPHAISISPRLDQSATPVGRRGPIGRRGEPAQAEWARRDGRPRATAATGAQGSRAAPLRRRHAMRASQEAPRAARSLFGRSGPGTVRTETSGFE